MTVAFRADAEVVNGTAGTSVVVARPAGTADGDLLVAFIAATGTPSISAPAGWTLVGTQDAASDVRLAAYWKVAAAEPASWTWTLGTSQRNWGQVGAYTGVNTSDPIVASLGTADTTAGTAFQSGATISLPTGAIGLSACAAVRAATGTATTWTGSGQNERTDVSTNAGAGVDISGRVQDSVYTGIVTGSYQPSWTASQSQTHGAMWALALRPAFAAYDGGLIPATVEAAFGYDSTSDPDTWVWTDITADVRVAPGITITKGAGPDSTSVAPASLTFELNNADGRYTPDNAIGAHWPNIQPDVPIRVRLPYGFAPPTERIVAFAESWEPSWDPAAKAPIVTVTAYGRLYAIQQNTTPVRSPLYRGLSAPSQWSGTLPFAYWPMEDSERATQFAAIQTGVDALSISGTVNLASASDLPASAALPVMTSTGVVTGRVSYAATGQWVWLLTVKMPSTPVVARTTIVQFQCTGTARFWRLDVVPGSPDTFNIAALDADLNILLDDAVSVDEAEFWGGWMMLSLGVTQNGSDVDYQSWLFVGDGGTGNTGTLASRTIGAAAVPRIFGFADMAVGHLVLYTDPTYDLAQDPGFTALFILDGRAGEMPISRFGRVCDEEGIRPAFELGPHVIEPFLMGPQPMDTVARLLQESAETEQGVVHDGGVEGDLVFVQRDDRYNAPVIMTIDAAQRQLQPSFAPRFDTVRRVTDSTVTRIGGSSARYTVDAKGPRQESLSLSLDSDVPLMNLAAWRVRLGTVEGMRYPQLPINLRRTPGLAEQWLSCRIGTRVQAINLTDTHGPSTVDVFVEGYTEHISKDRWEVTLNCSPADPYIVGVVEDTELGRLDTDGSILVSAVDGDDTALTVAATGGTPWITTVSQPTMFPFDLRVGGGERVSVTAADGVVRDAFTRSASSSWGTPTVGPAWTTSGGSASDYSVNGSKGIQSQGTVAVLRHCVVSVGTDDMMLRATVNLDTGSVTGDSVLTALSGRVADLSNYYSANLVFDTGDLVALHLFKRVAGVGTAISTTVPVFLGFGAGQQFTVVLWVHGSTIQAKAWAPAQQGEPLGWMVYAEDTSITSGTSAVLQSRLETGNTNTLPLQVQWDNFETLSPQTLTVTRGVNNVARAHGAGAALSLWTPMRLAL